MKKDHACASCKIFCFFKPIVLGNENIGQFDITVLHHPQSILILNSVNFEARSAGFNNEGLNVAALFFIPCPDDDYRVVECRITDPAFLTVEKISAGHLLSRSLQACGITTVFGLGQSESKNLFKS